MKNLLTKLTTGIFLLIFTSCGEVSQEEIIAGKKIVGKPIKIEYLEVAEFDFPEKMSVSPSTHFYLALASCNASLVVSFSGVHV